MQSSSDSTTAENSDNTPGICTIRAVHLPDETCNSRWTYVIIPLTF